MADPKVGIRDYQDSDLEYLSRWMRERDRLEVWASCRMEPEDAIKDSVRLSQYVKVVLFDGKPAVIFGVSDVQKNIAGNQIGVPWVLTTELVSKYPKTFLKLSQGLLPTLFNGYDILLNYVDVRYISAVRWIKSLGFWIGNPVPFGKEGEFFHPFAMKKEDLRV